MNILIVGKGGREHALAWKIAQSPRVKKIFCAPGNAGIAQLAECVQIREEDVNALVRFAEEKNIDLTVVGPEKPLYLGNIVNRFEERGLSIFGPNGTAASIEGSKIISKRSMQRWGIPTAKFKIFGRNSFTEGGAAEAIRHAKANMPCVIKVDGLADGKGVFLCFTEEEALYAINKTMMEHGFDGRDSVVIEEFLSGQEITFMVLTDGSEIISLPPAQDHKHLLDEDGGPNTGGMGAYSPVPMVNEEMEREIIRTIIKPALKGMKDEGWRYKGVLYAGLMLTEDGPKVLEFNCRFGDPELQPLVLLISDDIVPILVSIAEGDLTKINSLKRLCHSNAAAVCVVMASSGYGYSSGPKTGEEIRGLDQVWDMPNVMVFHAGTVMDGNIVKTAGGRILGVTAKAENLPEAIDLVYKAVSKISWPSANYRRDIGRKALRYGVQLKIF